MFKSNDVPPYFYLRHVLKTCPKAALTYIDLWRNCDRDNTVLVQKKEIKNEYHIHVNKFSHDLLALVSEGLANVQETPQCLHIELTAWQVSEEVFV